MRAALASVMCAVVLLLRSEPASGISAYGHAYSRPQDFTDAQIKAIASRFDIFTVEKDTASDVYGPESSIAATAGTAKRIKAINSSTRVLMYWNNALHYGFYECEKEVQPGWVYPNRAHGAPPMYNYSVPAFRAWWVKCAVDAVRNHSGLIDGLFLDGTPKLEAARAVPVWGEMVDEIRHAIGASAFVVDNGFYMSPSGGELAGEDAWPHTGRTYVERMSALATDYSPSVGVKYLGWLADASAAHPERQLVGHGTISGDHPGDWRFQFGLAAYMMVTASNDRSLFLANNGSYSIDGGLLLQPGQAYATASSCGEPLGRFRVAGPSSHSLSRRFEHGTVELDLDARTSSIQCGAWS